MYCSIRNSSTVPHVMFSCAAVVIRAQVQDLQVLLDPVSLEEALLEWLPVLERVLGPEDLTEPDLEQQEEDGEEEEGLERELEVLSCSVTHHSKEVTGSTKIGLEDPKLLAAEKELRETSNGKQQYKDGEPIRLVASRPLPSDLQADLMQLTSLCLDVGCVSRQGTTEEDQGGVRGSVCVESVCVFLRRYFFLLDQEHIRRACMQKYRQHPEVLKDFIAGMLGKDFFFFMFALHFASCSH